MNLQPAKTNAPAGGAAPGSPVPGSSLITEDPGATAPQIFRDQEHALMEKPAAAMGPDLTHLFLEQRGILGARRGLRDRPDLTARDQSLLPDRPSLIATATTAC
jgi:hypothetical protein